jgi:hypothetical protein
LHCLHCLHCLQYLRYLQLTHRLSIAVLHTLLSDPCIRFELSLQPWNTAPDLRLEPPTGNHYRTQHQLTSIQEPGISECSRTDAPDQACSSRIHLGTSPRVLWGQGITRFSGRSGDSWNTLSSPLLPIIVSAGGGVSQRRSVIGVNCCHSHPSRSFFFDWGAKSPLETFSVSGSYLQHSM